MILINKRKIFDPNEHILPNGCKYYAKSPQVVVFDDYIRIYFSSCSLDAKSKYLSHICYVDMNKDFTEIYRVSDKTIIPLGDLGCFDEHGIFPVNLVRDAGKILAYTCGWSRRISVSVETAIGLAISYDNGESFNKVGNGPVMASSLDEPYLVGDAFVKIMDSKYHMWYMYGTAWKKYDIKDVAERTYKIGYACSVNGIDWVRRVGAQLIPDRIGEDESQALPSVIKNGEKYHMFFCYRHSYDFRDNKDRGYRIGHAWSLDLEKWTRDDNFDFQGSGENEWDSEMQCYPHVFEMDHKYYMLYNGNQFGKYGFGVAELQL